MKHSEMTDSICDSNLLKRKTRGQIGLGGRAEERVEDLPCGCLGSGANPRSVLEARVWESSFSVALEVMEVEVSDCPLENTQSKKSPRRHQHSDGDQRERTA